MKGVSELEQMLAAERAEARLPEAAQRGLAGLRDALATGVPALGVAHGPLTLGGSALAKWLASVGLIAIGVASSGLLLFPAPAARPAQVAAAPAGQPVAPAASPELGVASPAQAAVPTFDARQGESASRGDARG